ncbi:CU044_5270 family protein [Nonomuraea sp. B19D2]|uniref:CU044_5270 family protein n=1 Tax=Nonomuraea sp. B19D2 TaxID=3159561 RepID=UPI0032D9FF2F
MMWDVAEHVVDRHTALAALAGLPERYLEVMAWRPGTVCHPTKPPSSWAARRAPTTYCCTGRAAGWARPCKAGRKALERIGHAPAVGSPRKRDDAVPDSRVSPAPPPQGGLMSHRPRSPHQEADPTDRMSAQLKPVELDQLTDEIYQRHRSDDLARMLRSPRVPDHSRRFSMSQRRLLVLIAGTSVAGLAAAAAVLVRRLITADPAPIGAAATRPASSAPGITLNARDVLLASATRAQRQPASTPGKYWYTRERTSERIIVPRGEPGSAKTGKPAPLPFNAFATHTQDSWNALDKGDITRTVTNQDVKVTFASAEDEAKWKAAGSQPLWPQKPSTNNDDDMPYKFTLGSQEITFSQLENLPTQPEKLEAALWQAYESESDENWEGGSKPKFEDYLWSDVAHSLLSAPTTPQTRAAFLRVLAQQPGITSLGDATDALGRTGTALAMQSSDPSDGGEYRLVISKNAAELIASEYRAKGDAEPRLRVTYENMSWVDELGERPQD